VGTDQRIGRHYLNASVGSRLCFKKEPHLDYNCLHYGLAEAADYWTGCSGSRVPYQAVLP
jgi:hypothetical protein